MKDTVILERLVLAALVEFVREREETIGCKLWGSSVHMFLKEGSKRVLSILRECEEIGSVEEALAIMIEEINRNA